jgi:8-oxo-dGTP diphosphatase
MKKYSSNRTRNRPGVDYVGITTPFYCNNGNGLFLLHKRSKKCRDEHGRWDPGSGQMEFGITPEENVLKEVWEEYGCAGEIQGRLPVHSIFREWNGRKTHWLAIPFFVKVNPAEVKINEPKKISEIGWFALDALPEPLHTGFNFTLSNYRKYFKKWSKRNGVNSIFNKKSRGK